jgi:hypothetical protein
MTMLPSRGEITHSNDEGTCVQLGHGVPGCARVRDSKDRQGTALRLASVNGSHSLLR